MPTSDNSPARVVALDPNDVEQVKRLMTHYAGTPLTDNEVPDMQKALRAMLAPEEPPAWTLVATNQGNPVRVFYRVEDREGMRRPWHAVAGGWHTWAEVCAAAEEDSGGVPEVLESADVKAMRARLDNVEKQAREWAEKDDEVSAMHSLTILNTTNRHGREILHLLNAEDSDD